MWSSGWKTVIASRFHITEAAQQSFTAFSFEKSPCIPNCAKKVNKIWAKNSISYYIRVSQISTSMKKEIIKDALLSALHLLNNEVESGVIDDLKEEYLIVIAKLENGLKELKSWDWIIFPDSGIWSGRRSDRELDHFPDIRKMV